MVPAAQRHAVAVGDGHHVVRVDVVEQEAHEAAALGLGAEEAHAFQLTQTLVGVGGQFEVVAEDVLAADGVEVVQRSVQADGAGDVRRAGLEFMRERVPRALEVVHRGNHLAAAVPRRGLFQHFLAPVKHADAGGAANLVAAERVEVAADGLHVHHHVARTLRAVHEGRDAEPPRARAEVGDGVERAEGV